MKCNELPLLSLNWNTRTHIHACTQFNNWKIHKQKYNSRTNGEEEKILPFDKVLLLLLLACYIVRYLCKSKRKMGKRNCSFRRIESNRREGQNKQMPTHICFLQLNYYNICVFKDSILFEFTPRITKKEQYKMLTFSTAPVRTVYVQMLFSSWVWMKFV